MSRPLTQSEPLTEQVKVRLAPGEATSIRTAAAASGRSVSDYLRACIQAGGAMAHPTHRPTPGRKQPGLAKRKYTQADPDLLFQLAQAGNSINQIAARLNLQNKSGQELDVMGSARSLYQIRNVMSDILKAYLNK